MCTYINIVCTLARKGWKNCQRSRYATILRSLLDSMLGRVVLTFLLIVVSISGLFIWWYINRLFVINSWFKMFPGGRGEIEVDINMSAIFWCCIQALVCFSVIGLISLCYVIMATTTIKVKKKY